MFSPQLMQCSRRMFGLGLPQVALERERSVDIWPKEGKHSRVVICMR